MGLTVVILSKNDSNLEKCAGAVRELDPDLRILVVDDGLSKAWPDKVAGVKPFVFARNANLGIKAAGRDDVLLVNDDAVLQPPEKFRAERPSPAFPAGGFSLMQRAAEMHPEFGIVSAAVIGPSGLCEHKPVAYPQLYELKPPLKGGVDLAAIRGCSRPQFPFICVLLPRRTIDRVGLLDERFQGEIDGEMIYAGEDTDYCYRVKWAGLELGIFDGCVVDHGTLPSTFRPDGKGLTLNATQKRFKQIHGIEMVL